jgi:hypothetical protein
MKNILITFTLLSLVSGAVAAQTSFSVPGNKLDTSSMGKEIEPQIPHGSGANCSFYPLYGPEQGVVLCPGGARVYPGAVNCVAGVAPKYMPNPQFVIGTYKNPSYKRGITGAAVNCTVSFNQNPQE